MNVVREAVAALWMLIDDAYGRVISRAAQAGGMWCTTVVVSPSERRYQRVGVQGETRGITVSLMLSEIEGRVRGGAFISTTRPYLSLFAAPVVRRGQMHWRVGTVGQVLTADFVEDLFLSVLDDEPEATRRLAPLVAYSLG